MKTKTAALKLLILSLAFGFTANASEMESPLQVGDAFNFTSAWRLQESYGPPHAVALHLNVGRSFNLSGQDNQPLSPNDPINPSSRVSFLQCGLKNLTINGSNVSENTPFAGKEAYTTNLFVTKLKTSKNQTQPHEIFVNQKRYSSDPAIGAYLVQQGYKLNQGTVNSERVQFRAKSHMTASPETHAYQLRSSDGSVKSVMSCVAWINLEIKETTSTQDFIREYEATTNFLKAGLIARDFNSLTTKLQDGTALNFPPFRSNQLAITGELILAPR